MEITESPRDTTLESEKTMLKLVSKAKRKAKYELFIARVFYVFRVLQLLVLCGIVFSSPSAFAVELDPRETEAVVAAVEKAGESQINFQQFVKMHADLLRQGYKLSGAPSFTFTSSGSENSGNGTISYFLNFQLTRHYLGIKMPVKGRTSQLTPQLSAKGTLTMICPEPSKETDTCTFVNPRFVSSEISFIDIPPVGGGVSSAGGGN